MSTAVIIPFHHRMDLLDKLLVCIQEFRIVIVDDGPNASNFSSYAHVHVLRSEGNRGFTQAVNLGMEYCRQQGIDLVAIINDDALISAENLQKLFRVAWETKGIVSPVIQTKTPKQKDQYCYGVHVSRWGRVRMLFQENSEFNAVLGVCLVVPTHFSLDSRFVHGFEDIELTYRAKTEGYSLRICTDIVCFHEGGASLSSKSYQGRRWSVYGHMCLFDSYKKIPVITCLSLCGILSEHSYKSIIQQSIATCHGVLDWVCCNSVATRIASSKAGSNKSRYNTTSRWAS